MKRLSILLASVMLASCATPLSEEEIALAAAAKAEFIAACTDGGQADAYCDCMYDDGKGVRDAAAFRKYASSPDDKLEYLAGYAPGHIANDIIRMRKTCGIPSDAK